MDMPSIYITSCNKVLKYLFLLESATIYNLTTFITVFGVSDTRSIKAWEARRMGPKFGWYIRRL